MAKFSVGGEEDGEDGPSSPRGKRQRTSVRINAIVDYSQENEPQEEEDDQGFDYGKEESENKEEESERHQKDEIDRKVREDGNRKAGWTPKSCSKNVKSPGCVRSKTNSSISMFLIDPEVFDCSICCEPLSLPIFQCENGHIACSSCCNKLKNKCASCSWPIGYNRCRAIEKVLESVKVPCKQSKYGCKEMVNYGNESDHDKTCIYAPCLCPLSDCNFMASSKQLSLHFRSKHTNSAINFQYNSSFTLCLQVNDSYHVLQEQDDGILFILSNNFEHLGSAITVSCIRPTTLKEAFSYDLWVKTQDLSLFLQSSMKNIQSSSDCCYLKRFLLIPHDLLGSCGHIKLDIRIWKNDSSPVRIEKKCG